MINVNAGGINADLNKLFLSKFFEMKTKEEREQKIPRKYVFNGKVVWTDGVIKSNKSPKTEQ